MAKGVTVKVTLKDTGLKKVLEQMRALGVQDIHVGVVGPRAADLTANGHLTNGVNALYQEYGTSDGHIPPRHFLRDSLNVNQTAIAGMLRTMTIRALGGEPITTSAGWVAEQVVERIRAFVLESHVRPLDAENTRDKKGPLPALVDSMSLLEALSYQIVRRGGAVLDAGADAESYESMEVG